MILYIAGSHGETLTFSKSMTTEQLIVWLCQQLEDEYKEGITALSATFKSKLIYSIALANP